ncbi:hypothetical protein F2P79_018082 [Pimephales promelas]|nr:hypothetical protein F2P79_018082 [Pimephales promelas]
MVLRAGEAAGMESEDNPGKLKCSTRRVRPPVWHQDYEMVHPHSSATNVRGQLQGGVNPEALLPSENTDVKSLTEEVKQMKSMLMNLGEMMKNMQDQSECSSFTSDSQSLRAASPERRTEQRDPSVEVKQMKSMLMNLGEMMKNMQDQSECSSFTSDSQSLRAASPERRTEQRDPSVDFRTSFVQELGECLRQHKGERQSLPPLSPSRLSGPSTLPPPPASMLPTPSARPSREPMDMQPGLNVHALPEPSVPCQRNLTPQHPMNANPIPHYLNRPRGVNQDLSQIYDFGHQGCYPSDPQLARSDVHQYSQMPGNAFYFPGPLCPPWMLPPYVPNGGVFRPPYFPYPFPDLPYALPIHSEYVDPLAAARQSPQAPHGPLPAPSIRVTASATNPLVMPACGSRYLSQGPALVDPGRHLEDLMKHLRIVCILPIGFILRQLLTPVFQPSQQFLYGQPQHLVLREITSVQSLPNVRSGDSRGFSQFAVRIRALVGMLQSWGHGEGARELACASHVHQLLSKLPPDQVASFARQTRLLRPDVPYNLIDFANWLEEEAECQSLAVQVSEPSRRVTGPLARDHSTATFFQGVSQEESARDHIQNQSTNPRVKFSSESALPSCAFCDSQAHHLSRCPGFREFDAAAKEKWITDNGRCWRCGRFHRSSNCNLKKGCPQCKGRHLGILHEVNTRKSEQQILYLRRPSGFNSVLLKVVRVVLTHNGKSLETYAILDDGSERTMLLSSAAEGLGLNGAAETLILRTIRQGTEKIVGATVIFSISSASQHQKKYEIKDAFTAKQLTLPEQTYPITTLQRRYQHLQGLPLQEFHKIRPLLLVGADHSHLLCSTECVRFGPPGSPVALHTCLGWTLHGPTSLVQESSSDTRCLLTSLDKDQLQRDVERLWQIDIFPYSKNSKAVIRSKQDQQAFEFLEQQTERHEINGIERYATPLLRVKISPLLHEPPAKPAVEHAKPAVRPSDELPKPSDELPEPPAVNPQSVLSSLQ